MKKINLDVILDFIVQIMILIGIYLFTRVDSTIGEYIIVGLTYAWILQKIIRKRFYIYEMILLITVTLLTGVNYLFYMGIILFVLSFYYMLKKKGSFLKIDKDVMSFGLMLIVGLISSKLIANDVDSAKQYSLAYIFIFLMLYGIKFFRNNIEINEKIAVRIFSISSFCIGFGFFLTHTLNELFSTSHALITYISNYGARSNTLAGIIAPFFMANILLLFESKDSLAKVISTISIIMFFIILIAIQSRGVYLGILIAFLWICFKKNKSKVLINLIIGAIIICTISMIFPDLFANIFNRFSIEHFEDNDISNGRMDIYKIAIDMFKSSPIIGNGFWQFEYYGIETKDPHNFILAYLASTGIVGTTTFILFLYFIYKRINREYNDENHSKMLVEINMMFFLITVTHGFIEPTLTTSAPLTFFILLTLLPTKLKEKD